MQITPLDTLERVGGLDEVALRLVVATLLGAAVGLNRELQDKPAGLRTHALVSLGAALLTVTGLLLADPGEGRGQAASRVIQGIVTGVGFIGGGVILRDESRRSVLGLTTAATVWLVACVGIVCGTGHWPVALLGLLLTLLVLMFGGTIERLSRRLSGRGSGTSTPDA